MQVSIGHIVEGGAAEIDGRLRSGDEIVSVDDQSVMNCSHHHVVQLMGKAAASGKVTLGIRRKISYHNQGTSTFLVRLFHCILIRINLKNLYHPLF